MVKTHEELAGLPKIDPDFWTILVQLPANCTLRHCFLAMFFMK